MIEKIISRRKFLSGSSAVAATFSVPMINKGSFQVFAQSNMQYSARTMALMEGSLVMDLLSIVNNLNKMMESGNVDAVPDVSDEQYSKLVASGINVYHPAVGLGGRNAKEGALGFFTMHNARIANRPDRFMRIDSMEDLDSVKASGKIGVILGLQNSAHFYSHDDVERFFHLGQRISQLTYNTQNLIGSGSTDRVDGGISSFGEGVVARMNKVGMAVDVSHSGDQTTLDAMELSTKPVLITHSNSRVLSNGHPRTKKDEAFIAMAKTGGVVGITGVRNFVRDKEPTNMEHLLDHYDHIRDLIGVEHLGIGSDMDPDGYDDMKPDYLSALKAGYKESYAFRNKLDTDGFDNPKKIFTLVEGLIRRGYTDEHITGILGKNFRRAFEDIWPARG
ncbi:MAG: dipeptidase [Sphingomonadales bacterium]